MHVARVGVRSPELRERQDGLGGDGARMWRGGARKVPASNAHLALEATRREAANDDAAPYQRIGLTLSVRW